MTESVLKVQDVSYQYGSRIVLKGISFQLHKGEMMGLFGPNGSGKTTLLKVILGLLPLQGGEVWWFGKPLKNFKDWYKIGYVSQKAASFNTGFPATVEEVVTMGLAGRLGLFRRPGKEEKRLVQQAIERVGLKEFTCQNIGELSGGQQQRVFIARALVSDPEVLILDEPTVGVDARSEAQFYEILQQLNEERGLSIILVSHDLGAVSARVHTAAFLNQVLHYHGRAEEFVHRFHHGH